MWLFRISVSGSREFLQLRRNAWSLPLLPTALPYPYIHLSRQINIPPIHNWLPPLPPPHTHTHLPPSSLSPLRRLLIDSVNCSCLRVHIVWVIPRWWRGFDMVLQAVVWYWSQTGPGSNPRTPMLHSVHGPPFSSKVAFDGRCLVTWLIQYSTIILY